MAALGREQAAQRHGGVFAQVGVAGVGRHRGDGPGQPEVLVELAEGEQPGVGGELSGGRRDTETASTC